MTSRSIFFPEPDEYDGRSNDEKFITSEVVAPDGSPITISPLEEFLIPDSALARFEQLSSLPSTEYPTEGEQNVEQKLLIRSAIPIIDTYLGGRSVIRQRYRDTFAQLGHSFYLAQSPISRLLDIRYGLDWGSGSQVLGGGAPESNPFSNGVVRVAKDGEFRIYSQDVSATYGLTGGYVFFVDYEAGYGTGYTPGTTPGTSTPDWTSIPTPIQEAIVRVAANLSYAGGANENRGGVAIIDAPVASLLNPYKTVRIY